MARSGSMTYDPSTGTWKSSSSSSSGSKSSTKSSTKKSTSSSGSKSPSGNKGGNLTSTNSDKNTATGSAEKKYNTIEYNTLEGTLNYIATKDTIKLKAGDTVRLEGLGKYLSGLYYVQSVKRNISSSGYTHSASVIKTDFGDSVKEISSSSSNTSNPEKKSGSTSPSKTTKTTEQKIHYLKKGECLWTVAEKYYGSGSQYTKIAKANNIDPSQYRKLPTGLKLIIP